LNLKKDKNISHPLLKKSTNSPETNGEFLLRIPIHIPMLTKCNHQELELEKELNLKLRMVLSKLEDQFMKRLTSFKNGPLFIPEPTTSASTWQMTLVIN
jgi:hypothetical protein